MTAGGAQHSLGWLGNPTDEETFDLRSKKLATQRSWGKAFQTKETAGTKAFLLAHSQDKEQRKKASVWGQNERWQAGWGWREVGRGWSCTRWAQTVGMAGAWEAMVRSLAFRLNAERSCEWIQSKRKNRFY